MDVRLTKLKGGACDRAGMCLVLPLGLAVLLQACGTISPGGTEPPAVSPSAVQTIGSAPPQGVELSVSGASAAETAAKAAEPDVQVVRVPLVEAPQGRKIQEGARDEISDQSPSAPPAAAVVETAPIPKAVPPSSPLAHAAVAPKDPRTFSVTVGHKDKTHIGYGAGHDMGFIINGVQGRDLVVVRGQEYTFEVRTDIKHDFYLSNSSVGWGGAPFTEGVSGQFTFDGDVVFRPTEKTPDLLYYQCRNHQYMGGRIAVVNTAADVAAAEARLAKDRAAAVTEKQNQGKVESSAELKAQQKISYAEMLFKFKSANLPDDRKKAITDRIALAKQHKDKGDFARATALAGEAADILSGKQPAVSGPSAEELAEQEKIYTERLQGLQALQKSHADSVKRAQKSGKKGGIVDYDHKEVDKLTAEAQDLAKARRYDEAAKVVGKSELLVTKALNDMLSSQTLVYELTFDTPKDEYDYEFARFKSYDELIPVAIDVRKPNEQAISLMQTYVNKAHFYRDKAAESAAATRFEEAIAIMRDATAEVRRGLMALGVSM